MEAGAHGAGHMTHFRTCLLHDDKRRTRCSGTLKKGGNCVNRAVGSFKPGMMPTCHVHRRQLKRMGRCRAPLRCGFECGRICEWKLHGFQLCLDHCEHPMTCHFLKVPIEMRLRIYQLLLPDRPIPARYEKSSLTSDGGGVYTAILCVNRQIHDEAAGLLYRTRAFSIELLGDWMSMCNLSQNFTQNSSFGYKHHALEDHQWQQMILGQQGLFMARQGRRILGGASSSAHTPTIRGNQSHAKSPNFDSNVPVEPIREPPLSKRYFNMIQSFRIEIVLPSPSAWWLPNSDAASHKASMSRLLDYCDHLHRLIGRLRIIQRPIARLEIVIRFGNAYLNRRDVFPIAQFLLRPFRRLHNVAKPDLLSITIQDSLGEVELLTRDWASSPAGGKLAAYLEHLFEHMSSSQPPPELPVFKVYWQLERLLSYMKEHYRHAHPKIGKITGLLYAARFAREVEDLSSFRAIWNQVVDIWSDCLNEHVEFQSNVALSINAIHSTVQNGS
ncbi:uncharacterized protein PAC_01962 [Phialocephala subalpina]|uniref:Uncharacterized protein n=1 Tax=Phialocephala subalpina TaxID=576137 RepID=A0A1L7WH70_9HELO|nr:uncharacterized protein PAC_01962 [Phialocephala subalpina]